MVLVRFGVDPYGEELRSQISSFGLFEADVVFIFGVRRADVIVLIKETLRRILVRVNDEGGFLYAASARTEGGVLRKTKDGARHHSCEENKAERISRCNCKPHHASSSRDLAPLARGCKSINCGFG